MSKDEMLNVSIQKKYVEVIKMEKLQLFCTCVVSI